MNKVTVTGYIAKEPIIQHGRGARGISVAKYTLAVRRPYAVKEGEPDADFIRCTAFGKKAVFVENYLIKGDKIEVCGSWKSGSYLNKDGQRVYTNELIVAEQSFAESRRSRQATNDNRRIVHEPEDCDDVPLPWEVH